MSHELENNNGVWSFAFSPVEGPGWHQLGTEIPDDATVAAWRTAAGHDFTVSKRSVHYAGVNGAMHQFADRFVVARDDNNHPMGVVSDVYKIVQAQTIDDICDEFAALSDGQLARSAAFTLRNGEMICSTYAYRGDGMTIGGDKHKANLMATTTFDGTGSSLFWPSIIRAVCKNTIAAGLAGAKNTKVAVRHNAKLDPDTVRTQLAELAQATLQFKALGDALAKHSMSPQDISTLFKSVLDIPADATQNAKGEVVGTTTRKFNQFAELCQAFKRSTDERGGSKDAFTALQAVTRYVDHARSVKANGAGNETIARFDAANFGSGAALKAKAVGLLMPMIDFKVAA
jgi:phage/plasmid-like protein (TIGR03299 family)